MTLLSQILNIVTAILSLYMMLLMIRVILTWFRRPLPGAAGQVTGILARITDPYLNLFRGIPFLRAGMLDFSPVASMILLGMVIQLTSAIAQYGRISVGLIGALLISSLWGIISFILELLLVFMVVRFISTYFKAGYSPFWRNLDTLLYKVIEGFLSLFTDRELSFRAALIFTSLAFLAVIVLGQLGFGWLTQYLYNLPV